MTFLMTHPSRGVFYFDKFAVKEERVSPNVMKLRFLSSVRRIRLERNKVSSWTERSGDTNERNTRVQRLIKTYEEMTSILLYRSVFFGVKHYNLAPDVLLLLCHSCSLIPERDD